MTTWKDLLTTSNENIPKIGLEKVGRQCVGRRKGREGRSLTFVIKKPEKERSSSRMKVSMMTA